MGLRELIIDAWSWLNYKPIMSQPPRRGVGPFGELASGWVPAEDLRRLQTYKVLIAYDQNQAGQVASAAGDENGLDRRELGDPAKLNASALGYLLGPSQSIVVPGAEGEGDGAQAVPHAALARDVQDRLRGWARRELLPMRMQQCERSAVRYGDGVYTLAWDAAAGRPQLRTMDPGWYFPEWTDDEADGGEFPTTVHFAWELPEDPATGRKARIRRITYELGPIAGVTRSVVPSKGGPHREWAAGNDGEALLLPGDRVDAGSGMVARTYPWSPDKPSFTTCYLTDAEWLLEDLKAGHNVYNLPAEKARYRVRGDGEVLHGLDLQIDFVPVVHITNSIVEVGEHWGQPVISRVMQALDELAATDTDSSAASGTTGTPIVALSGVRLPKDRSTGAPVPLKVEAGTVWSLNEGGSMSTLDTSPQLRELRARTDHLLDRLAGNSRLTASGLGVVKPSEVPSGYALSLSLGPLGSLVGEMRLARAHKYQLLLKMAGRLFQAGQVGWPTGELPAAQIVWGPHLPTDKTEALDLAVKGYEAGLFSLETCVRMLSDAGFPITDITDEIRRIQARAFDAAARLADATGDTGVVRDFLGLPAEGPAVPSVPLAKAFG
ncbi:hypothetical protein [Kitasatospora brasiliensis]|uniref:hypothetical protein n=1 Tax=Kitasatospora brasiliensis TaxID=3058040 RepID=UPI00292E9637|nr:hypothetical protein [Kitasatospora sp. K002]